MPSLYDYLDVEVRLKTVLTDEAEITDEELREFLKIKADNERDIEEKLVGYAKFIKQIKGEIPVLDDEIQRLKKRKVSREKLISRMKEAMKYASRVAGITNTVDAVGNGMRRQNIAASVIVKDEFRIKEQFLKYTAVWDVGALDWVTKQKIADECGAKEFICEVSKKAILKAWRESEKKIVPDGVEIEQGETIVIL